MFIVVSESRCHSSTCLSCVQLFTVYRVFTVLRCIIREEIKRKDRYFNGKWLATWSWLQYHRRKKAAFCSICSPNQSEVNHDPKATFIYKDKSQHIPGVKLLMEENKFVSHSLLGEQQEMLVLEARRALNMELQSVKFYVTTVDEPTDISKSEHMSLSVRHCTEQYDVKEEFIGICQCREGATTDALFEYIKDILIRCQLDLKKLVGMTFDGEMAMKCLAEKIKSETNKSAIFIHCLAHCQELIFKDATKHCPA